eukprot:scaffold10848_cov57-Phaeocystis_antarctica.AAC.4
MTDSRPRSHRRNEAAPPTSAMNRKQSACPLLAAKAAAENLPPAKSTWSNGFVPCVHASERRARSSRIRSSVPAMLAIPASVANCGSIVMQNSSCSTRRQPSCPLAAAWWAGVQAPASAATFAATKLAAALPPSSCSTRRQLACPLAAAWWAGVLPFASTDDTLAAVLPPSLCSTRRQPACPC